MTAPVVTKEMIEAGRRAYIDNRMVQTNERFHAIFLAMWAKMEEQDIERDSDQ